LLLIFFQAVCGHLQIEVVSIKVFPYVWWIQNALRAKFAKKKNQLHYETRTHIRQFTIKNVTGSTASTFLEYIQRNIPEGIAMKVTYDEIAPLPEMIRTKMEVLQQAGEENAKTVPMSEQEKSVVEALLKEGAKQDPESLPSNSPNLTAN
uniref:Small ribosomal subunit protein uS10m n=1 Tax=Gongylonema pulchrum TaxID=637853 RepID=A0A183E7B2_9BILA